MSFNFDFIIFCQSKVYDFFEFQFFFFSVDVSFVVAQFVYLFFLRDMYINLMMIFLVVLDMEIKFLGR